MTGFIIAIIFSLLVLTLGADRFVKGACVTAGHFGMPPLLIGMVIIGFGTSAPEMVVSALAALQGNPGLALGNVLGSNLFNTLAVVGIAGAIHPGPVLPEVFYRDCMVMGALTLSLFAIGYGFRGPGRINRFEGTGLITAYVGYTGWLILVPQG